MNGWWMMDDGYVLPSRDRQLARMEEWKSYIARLAMARRIKALKMHSSTL